MCKGTTNTLCTAIERQAKEQELPAIYLASSADNKEERALAQAQERKVTSGLIAVLSCVEPCRSVVIRRKPTPTIGSDHPAITTAASA